MDLARGVISGELDLAIVTAPPNDPKITAATFARSPLYVALPENHRAARKESLKLQDLNKDVWGLFTAQANPLAHDAIMHLARTEQIIPNEIHEVLSTSDAFYVVIELGGVAFVSKATALNTQINGIVFKPLSDESLWFDTCLVMKAEEKSRVINQFGREFLRKYSPQPQSATQMALGEIA
jgi:DNA-binding transcriptional LysR family regulator